MLNNLIEITKMPEDINQLSPLNWAYVGDSVFELYIRTNYI